MRITIVKKSQILGALCLILFVFLITYWTAEWLGVSQDIEPLLKGPPQFIVLSLVVAFAVYFRQISISAEDLWDKIREEEEEAFFYPIGRQHTEDKMRSLERTSENLSIVAPFMVALTIFITIRIVFDSILRFPNSPFQGVDGALGIIPGILPMVDFVIAVWILVLFLAFAQMHSSAIKRNEKIRADVKNYVQEFRPVKSNTVETRTRPVNAEVANTSAVRPDPHQPQMDKENKKND